MKFVTDSENLGKEIGNIYLSIYNDSETCFSSFNINTENDDLAQFSYVIEDALKLF